MSTDLESFELLRNLHQFNEILKSRPIAISNHDVFAKFTKCLQSSYYRVQVMPIKLQCHLCCSELSSNPIYLNCSHALCSQHCLQSLFNTQLSGNLNKFSNLTCTCSVKISSSIIFEAYGGKNKFFELLKQFEPNILCHICARELPASSFITLKCEHRFCVDCIQQFIEFLISEGRVGDEIACALCQKDIDPLIILDLLDEETKNKYNSFLISKLTLGPGEILVKCIGRPGRNCEYCIIVSIDRDEFECPECKIKFCPKCKLDVHPKLTCEQKKAIESKENSEFKELIENGTMKICPWCAAQIIKDNGCKYMTCKSEKCNGKRSFCWDCNKKLESKHEAHSCVSKEIFSNRLKAFFKKIFR